MLEPLLKPLQEDELAAILAAAILDGKSGFMSRYAEGYLAGVCATYLVDRLVLAGIVAVRTAHWTAGDDGEADAVLFGAECRGVRGAGVDDMHDNRSPRGNKDR